MRQPRLRREWPGLALLACAVAFWAVALADEVRIGRVPLNDSVFHLAAAERLADSFRRGEPFLDPWVSEWSLGYPVWRSYQPLPHLLAAAFLQPFADHAAAFAFLTYALLALLPASVYVGTRLMGFTPTAAGLASLLVLAPSELGEYGRYGLGLGAYVWRGSGLFTQLVAIHFLVLALGATARFLDTGRSRALAAMLLALTALSHLIFGYVAFVSAAVLALVGPSDARARRLARLSVVGAIALVLLAWFVVPLLQSAAAVNHSRWEAEYKWDSFGAPAILSELVSGRLLDAGRKPWLSLLALIGAAVAVWRLREPLPRRLLALAVAWLVLFFGRATWGHLLLFAGVPADLHLHRLQAGFELMAVLLAAWGLEHAIRTAAPVERPIAVSLAALVGVAALAIAGERVRYLREGTRWGDESLAAFEQKRAVLEASIADVRAILAARPGRASAGLAAGWGGTFKIGAVPMYAFLTRAHADQASFLYHSMSPAADLMPLRNEDDGAQATAFGVRAVVAPSGKAMAPYLRRRASHGDFTVYEASGEGYFGLVDVGARYVGPPSTAFEPSAAWLQSTLLRAGIVVALDDRVDRALPPLARWQSLPPPDPAFSTRCGRLVTEAKEGETYRARFALARACYAFVKLSWHPDLEASVDGQPAPLLRVTPVFGAVALSPGEHDVVVAYRPGPLKAVLFVLGLVALAAAAAREGRLAAGEESVARRAAAFGTRIATPRAAAALAVTALALLALRPLFRRRLIAGHDATGYPPRMVEFARAVGDGQVPPVWAPDLGSGHGQPLFEFAPPLVHVAALPFQAAGLHLADGLQLAVAALHVLGAAAVYRLGRRMGSRVTAGAGAAAWLFAPYTALDLYVRSAFAEATAVAVAPLALLALMRAVDRPSPARAALAGAAVSLVLVGHNGAALLLLPALALLAGVAAHRSPRALAASAGALALALGLSAFFWLPAMAEKGFVQVDLLRQDFLRWSEHAVFPHQLLWSPWGHGFSVPGDNDGMSFALGPLHLLLAAAGTVIAWRATDRRRRVEVAALAAVAVLGAWLATSWSAPLWSRVETLQYLAYPWRALLLPGLCLPLLALPAFERLGPRKTVAATALLVAFNLPHTEPKGYLTFDDEYYAPASIAEKGINTTTREEYTPRWVERRPPWSPARLRGVEVRRESLRSARQEFEVQAPAATEVETATFYYPGWTVEVDGVGVPVSPAPVDGTMRFSLSPGPHRVVLALGSTPLRRAARTATAASLVLAAVALTFRRRFRASVAGAATGKRPGLSPRWR
jgi:hypothetical protein